MAITKIWSVKSRLDTSLNYISNPDKTSVQPDIDAREGVIKYIKNKDKTEQCKFVSAFGCSKDNAFSDMVATQRMFERNRRKDGVVAYHIVQSFKDFETTPEIAHKCGQELVKRLFEGKYECVLATHLDHAHLHNHIIINATSYFDGTKYKNNFKDYFIDIRGISDQICRENCLSVIDKPQRRGMHYGEWLALKDRRNCEILALFDTVKKSELKDLRKMTVICLQKSTVRIAEMSFIRTVQSVYSAVRSARTRQKPNALPKSDTRKKATTDLSKRIVCGAARRSGRATDRNAFAPPNVKNKTVIKNSLLTTTAIKN